MYLRIFYLLFYDVIVIGKLRIILLIGRCMHNVIYIYNVLYVNGVGLHYIYIVYSILYCNNSYAI